jgi:hypothetical protein
METQIFCIVTQCSLVDVNRRFRGTSHPSSVLKCKVNKKFARSRLQAEAHIQRIHRDNLTFHCLSIINKPGPEKFWTLGYHRKYRQSSFQTL